LLGRGGHGGVGRAVCACSVLGSRCVCVLCFLQVLSRIPPGFLGDPRGCPRHLLSRTTPVPPSTPSPSACTTCACTPECRPGRAACSPEPEFPRSPPGSHCRGRPSASPLSQWTHLTPSLELLGANRATLCSAPPLSSPETERPRPCHH
jgi:hypothetical protein